MQGEAYMNYSSQNRSHGGTLDRRFFVYAPLGGYILRHAS